MAPQDDHFDEPVSHNTSNRLESSTNRSQNRQTESRLSQDHSLNLINDLRRKHSKNMSISIIQAGEVNGAEEIILKEHRRKYSLRAHTDITVLYINQRDFLERVFNPHPWLKHLLCEKLELQQNFHTRLEQKVYDFNTKNCTPKERLPDGSKHPISSARVVRELAATAAKRNAAKEPSHD